jgi:hypothetical protein
MTTGGMTSANTAIAAGGGNTKRQSTKHSSNPCENRGSSSINPHINQNERPHLGHQRAISACGGNCCDVMVVVGRWLLGHVFTVGIVHIFYGINLFCGLNDLFDLKFRWHVRTCRLSFRQI